MKWNRLLLPAVGVALGGLRAVRWCRGRRVPTVRVSHALGGGSDVSIEWIEIK